jgi:asparagine synthase (glutamine-hydrolysing)
MKNEIAELKEALDESVRDNMCEGILLSGGLDTSIIATIAAKHSPKLKAFTIAFGEAPDLEYSTRLAGRLSMEHHILTLDEKDLTAGIKPTIEMLHSFDPMGIRNSTAIYLGLKYAKKHVKSVMTGDGGDELFFGYSFLGKMSEKALLDYASRLYRTMHFSSIELGEKLGIKVAAPFISGKVKRIAFALDPKLKIRDGVGKWILRKAYESELTPEFAWRAKTPIEYGSGSTALTGILEAMITDDEFRKKKREYETEGVKIRNKEHLYYYGIYRDAFGRAPIPKEGEAKCRGCGGGLPVNTTSYCRICGEENA